MTRIVSAALVAALFVASALHADDTKPKDGAVDRVAEAKAFSGFTKSMAEFQAKYAKAKPDERKDLIKERPDAKVVIEKANKLIEADPKDEPALEALMFLAQYNPQFGAKEFDALTAYHITSPKIARACLKANGRTGLTPEGEKFLEAVLAKNKNKEPLGFANYVMAQAKQRSGNEQAALPYLEKIEKFYSDVELVPGRKLGSMVKGTIFAIRNLAIGKTAPAVVSKDLDDKKVELASLRGKVVVLDFWATWCPPCRASIPHSNELVKKLKDKPFVFVSISSDAKKETLTEFLTKNEMPWTHWWEGVGETTLGQVWGVTGIPTVYVIDAKGVIRHKQVGFDAAAKEQNEKFDELIESLVKEAEEKK